MNRAAREPRLFWPALWRMALAGVTFLVVYGACNRFTATRADVPTLMFEWEWHIPFIKEMVVPYWSLDLLFCGAFFLCASKAELNLLTRRLIAAVLASAVFFLLFPLKLGFPRPEPQGWTAPLFALLYANDQPYNLAPSLHISLRSLVWMCYGAHLTGWLRRLAKLWFFLIGLSTLLVWQHHVVDVAAGFVMGWAIAVLFPGPRQTAARTPSPRLTWRYGAGALVLAGMSFLWLGFVWPAVSCAIMALAYGTGSPRILGKENGTFSPGAEWCLLPVLIVARLVQHRWLRRTPGWREIDDGIFLGRAVTAREAEELAQGGDLAVLDLTAEANAPVAFREKAVYHNLPLLDLVAPGPESIAQALALIRQEHAAGRRVYLHCRLGLQRSALIAAHWLESSGKAADLAEAKQIIRRLEPLAVI